MSAKATGSSPANGDAKNRAHQHHDGSTGRAYTVDQKSAVIRVRKCSPTAFYDILGLESVRSTCSDGEIKKAYRKLSLLTHPDKNGYDGADEAFKMVSRAFQVLSDSEKKEKYDRFGGDPESRFGSAGGGGGGGGADRGPAASPFSGFARSAGARQGGWEGEVSPEDLFRQFFGGGMGMGGPFGGGLFDTGPNFVFNMGGGPGIRVQQFGGGRPRRRPHNHADAPGEQSFAQAFQSLLPLLLLFLIPLLSSLFSSSSNAVPAFRFDNVKPYTQQHTTDRLKVPYWVNPTEVEAYTAAKWRDLDKTAERSYVGNLELLCEREQSMRDRLVQEAQGFFFTDTDKLQRARDMKMSNCQRMKELGISGRSRY